MNATKTKIFLPHVLDPNVEVIYVCPVNMNDEMRQYYTRLIDVMATVTGQNSAELNARLKIITPDCHDRFPVSDPGFSLLSDSHVFIRIFGRNGTF